MEFNQALLNPGIQLEESSATFKAIQNSLQLILAQMKARVAEVANSQKFDFKLQEFRIGEKEKFIGAMVTQFTNQGSAEKNSLSHLVNNVSDFLVCLKSDGIRYLMVVTNKGGAYFLDRMNNIFEVQTDISTLAFDPQGAEETKIEHILDGELVHNQTGLAANERFHFHLFDCILYKRSLVVDQSYLERMECCQLMLCFQRFIERMSDKGNGGDNPSKIFVYVKDFYPAKSTQFLLQKLGELPAFKDKIDGLIFTKINYPYYPGRNQGIIKWKPSYLNTIDFLVVENAYFTQHSPLLFQSDDLFVFELYCNYNGRLMLFDYMFVFDVDKYINIKKEFKHIDTNDSAIEGVILECNYDKNQSYNKMDEFYKIFYEPDYEVIEGLIQRSCLGKGLSEDSTSVTTLLNSLEKRSSELSDSLKGNWTGLRVRLDKSHPNGFITAKNVFNSIFEDSVSEALLLKKIEEGYELLSDHKSKRIRPNK